MTNTVVEPGASIKVLAVMTNGSTNAIRYLEMNNAMDFDLTLTNAFGKSYYLTPELATRNLPGGMYAGQQLVMAVPVTIRKSVEPGDYMLVATRNFSSISGNFKMESNPLRIQIK